MGSYIGDRKKTVFILFVLCLYFLQKVQITQKLGFIIFPFIIPHSIEGLRESNLFCIMFICKNMPRTFNDLLCHYPILPNVLNQIIIISKATQTDNCERFAEAILTVTVNDVDECPFFLEEQYSGQLSNDDPFVLSLGSNERLMVGVSDEDLVIMNIIYYFMYFNFKLFVMSQMKVVTINRTAIL